jgi:hypothetical protein
MAGFADAGNDHAPTATQDEVDRPDETIVELIAKRAHGVRFDVEHVASERECPVAIDFRYHSRSIAKALVRRAGPAVPSRCLYRCLYRPLNLVARRFACAVPLTNEDALPMRFCR